MIRYKRQRTFSSLPYFLTKTNLINSLKIVAKKYLLVGTGVPTNLILFANSKFTRKNNKTLIFNKIIFKK